ncbi:MAG: pyridoxamine 5'-phosphate oxidase family protein [Thiobacillaceae bacterium]
MARIYPELNDAHVRFIQAQHIFFSATAPQQGRINVSPKGLDSFRILSTRQVGYIDLTGSGNETAAHLRENGRFTVMFCSFDSEPLILRLYGHGVTIQRQNPAWPTLRPRFPDLPGERQIILLNIDGVQTSCGYAVPRMIYSGDRETLAQWAEKKGPTGLLDYWRDKNQLSIDGLSTGLLEN